MGRRATCRQPSHGSRPRLRRRGSRPRPPTRHRSGRGRRARTRHRRPQSRPQSRSPRALGVAAALAVAGTAALGVGDGLVVVVAHAATRIESETRSVAGEGAERVVHVRSLLSFEVGCASIIRPPGRSGADRHRGSRPLARDGLGRLREEHLRKVGAVVAIEVDPSADPRHGAVRRVLPEGPALATPVLGGNARRARGGPVSDPQDVIAVLGEPAWSCPSCCSRTPARHR